MPMNTSEPIPAKSRPGSRTMGEGGPARSGRLDDDDRADHGGAEDRGERGQHDAGHLDRLGGRASLETLGRFVAPVARQADDREADDQGGQREDRDRPPPGGGVEPRPARQVDVDPPLDGMDDLEERPTRQGHQYADQGRRPPAAPGSSCS
jgi:hypothetical protein